MTRKQEVALFAVELVLVLGLWLADRNGFVPISSTPFMLAIGWISLRMRGLGWRDVGLKRPPEWLRACLLGCGLGLGLELLATLATTPLLARWLGQQPDLTGFQPIVGNFKLLLFFLVINWVLAAFGEELAYRGYLLNRLAGSGRDRPLTWIASVLAVSLIFGLQHDYQGLTGIVQEGLSGLWLGLIYLACGRNLTVPIIAHGVSNSLAFILIFLGRYPGVGGP